MLFADPRKAVIHSVTDAQTMFLWQDDSYISTRAPARGNLGHSLNLQVRRREFA